MKTAVESRDCVACRETNCFFKQNAKIDWLEIIGNQKQTFEYKKGDILFAEGEEMRGIYSIHYGAVKELIQGDEDEEIISFSSAGMLIGYRGLGPVRNEFKTTAVALNDVEVVYFPLSKFMVAMHANPMMMQSLLSLSISDLNWAEMKVRFLMKASAEEKIIRVLKYLQGIFGFKHNYPGQLAFTPSRKDIVNFSGLSYETVTRALNALKREGKIDFNNKEITLLSDFLSE